MYSLPLADSFKDDLYKLVLAADVKDAKDFHKAKITMMNLAQDLANGTLTIKHTLRSVFVAAYKKAVSRPNRKVEKVEEAPVNVRPVDFYDWVNERESEPTANNRPSIENWLEW